MHTGVYDFLFIRWLIIEIEYGVTYLKEDIGLFERGTVTEK